jgi:hypothetical protein
MRRPSFIPPKGSESRTWTHSREASVQYGQEDVAKLVLPFGCPLIFVESVIHAKKKRELYEADRLLMSHAMVSRWESEWSHYEAAVLTNILSWPVTRWANNNPKLYTSHYSSGKRFLDYHKQSLSVQYRWIIPYLCSLNDPDLQSLRKQTGIRDIALDERLQFEKAHLHTGLGEFRRQISWSRRGCRLRAVKSIQRVNHIHSSHACFKYLVPLGKAWKQ